MFGGLYFGKHLTRTGACNYFGPHHCNPRICVHCQSWGAQTNFSVSLLDFGDIHSNEFISLQLADILIVMAICWRLYHRRTGFAKTDSTIMALMSYSINSGLLTSMLITFVTVPNSLISMMLFWLVDKCYVNSFLAM